MTIMATSAALSLNPVPQSMSLAAKVQQETPEQAFLKYAEMTPAERLFASMLGQLGITQDQFKSMSPADQQKVVQRIQDQAQKDRNKTGLVLDKSI